MALPVSGGARYGTLAAELLRRGFALHNLATAVGGLERMTADGGILTAGRGETADFDGMVVGLGALGIVSSVTLKIEPAWLPSTF